MKLVKLKTVIEDLEKLKDRYIELKSLLVDQIRDDQIDEAKVTFEEVVGLKNAIKQMEDLEVNV